MYTIEELKAHPMRIISTILACDTSGLFLLYMSLHTCDFGLHKIFAATYYFDSRCESELNALSVLSYTNAVLAVFYFMATIGLQFCICVDLILSLKRPFAQKETRMNYYSSPNAFSNNNPTGTSRFSDLWIYESFVFASLNQLSSLFHLCLTFVSPLFHLSENNGRRLTEMRFAVANIGNELLQCPIPLQTNPSGPVDGGVGHQEILVAVSQNPSNPAKEKSECRWDRTWPTCWFD